MQKEDGSREEYLALTANLILDYLKHKGISHNRWEAVSIWRWFHYTEDVFCLKLNEANEITSKTVRDEERSTTQE